MNISAQKNWKEIRKNTVCLLKFLVAGGFFSSCGLPRVSKFSTKACREKMLLKNSNTAFALVIRSLWGSDELRHRPVPCKALANVRGCSVSMVHTGVEMGPSLL